MTTILNNIDIVTSIHDKWNDILLKEKFPMTEIYLELKKYEANIMHWKNLMYCNAARPRAVMTLWLSCHQRLATKDRLMRYGMVANSAYYFCEAEESNAHLFFGCNTMR